jgi:hypothetical protein
MLRGALKWLGSLTEKVSEVLAEYLDTPERAPQLLPFAEFPVEKKMDVAARKVTAAVLYTVGTAIVLVPSFSPRLTLPIGDLMHRLASLLVAGL